MSSSTPPSGTGTRDRLLTAAVSLIAASPGEDVSLRAVCDAAGVKLPTLYHFFGSKAGLLHAITDHGFELYVAAKRSHESNGDPIEDLRSGWDAHVAFGIDNPGLYALMYGQVTPGQRPKSQEQPTAVLRGLTAQAHQLGLLAVPADEAADLILATNVGVTLQQIVTGVADPLLTRSAREAIIGFITGARTPPSTSIPTSARTVLQSLSSGTDILTPEEVALLRLWLRRLAQEPSATRDLS